MKKKNFKCNTTKMDNTVLFFSNTKLISIAGDGWMALSRMLLAHFPLL